MKGRKTKIVCSMGPTTENLEVVCDLLRSGMNVARFNFSHGTHEYHKKNIETVREASRITKIPCAILLDTKGPEIRTGTVVDDGKNGGKIKINSGDIFLMTNDDCSCVEPVYDGETLVTPGKISLSWKKLPEEIEKDCKILIADGLIEMLVLETDKTSTITCKALNSGSIGSKKNVNVIGIHPDIPVLSEQDKKDIEFGIKIGVDFIAASFISSASDVVSILRFIEPFNSKVRVIAKIENEEGLDDIEDIIEVASGVMVARGDLGVQLATERIPLAQKKIIQACNRAGKPVITATQMLDSMITNPRPTRAELTDVANAIFDGTDAVMLSGETANGAYPVESVKTMDKIARTVEGSETYKEKMRNFNQNSANWTGSNPSDIGSVMAHAAYATATDIQATSLLVPTISGNTPRLISRFRPEQMVIAATPNETVYRQLLLNWGVYPLLVKIAEDSEEMIQNALKIGLEAKVVSKSDRIVMVCGMPIFSPMMINTIRVLLVGTVLARGQRSGGVITSKEGETSTKVTGRVIRAEDAQDAVKALKKESAEILVTRNLDMAFVPILRVVDGLVIENPTEMDEEILSLINPNLIWISQVTDAMKKLEPGSTVTIDSSEKIVYEGTV
ncbi:MAG: pyruvate kinase [Spirochaetaceae bacterium]|nr:pyruvate kinase [Spirochaetaceae bacterium]MBP3449704.1 pyruvate kinase [Spirochaetaceae bacterium]MBQ3025450.1 pyruvate kinase [Spirochaetaceae bacterium]